MLGSGFRVLIANRVLRNFGKELRISVGKNLKARGW